MSHVFVSYAKEDGDFALLLKERLATAKLDAWLYKEDLKAGEQWEESIDDAIRSAYAVIVVITPYADASKYVTYEWSFAVGLNKAVVPILLSKWSYVFTKSKAQWIFHVILQI